MSNCKQGDMARMIEAHFPENVGLIVTVLEPCAPREKYSLAWKCKPAWPVRGTSWTNQSVVLYGNYVAEIPDAWLRPIRPEADPVTTDVVAGVEA